VCRTNQVSYSPELVEIRTGWNELDFVSADRFELAQDCGHLVFAAREAGGRRHRVDVFGRYPIHIAPQMPVDLLSGIVDRTERIVYGESWKAAADGW
jgi:hypothetical protein